MRIMTQPNDGMGSSNGKRKVGCQESYDVREMDVDVDNKSLDFSEGKPRQR